MHVANSLLELIGETPLVRLSRIGKGLPGEILGKLESKNPLGSVKDRIAWAMIEDASKCEKLKPGQTVVEPTSGNTGIGLAFVCAIRKHRLILTMPDTMSAERRRILKALGAELVLTSGKDGMKGAIHKAEELTNRYNAFMPKQFENPANPRIHEQTTAQEIWRDTEGRVDIVVAGIGTGGTITGISRALKGKNPNIKCIGVEPSASPVLSGGNPGPHAIQGIGAGFVPRVLERELVDDVVTVSAKDAISVSRRLASEEGIVAGFSSGAAMSVAMQVVREQQSSNTICVVILPDTGERYLSTNLFEEKNV